MDNLQEAINNVEKIITQIINNPPEDISVNELIRDWNTIRRIAAQKMVDKEQP